MSEFVIATYEHEVKAAWNGTISDQDLFQRLLDAVIFPVNIMGKNNELIMISKTKASELTHRVSNVSPKIKKASSNPEVTESIVEYFETNIVVELQPTLKSELVYKINRLVQEDNNISDDKKRAIGKLASKNDIAAFLSATFLLAVVLPNKISKQIVSSSSNEELPEIPVPSSVDSSERSYTKPLLNAYGQEAHKPDFSIKDLDTYPRYKKNFGDQRGYYYAAEALRRGIRDMYSKEKDPFDVLENEIYEGVIETWDDPCKNGLARLRKVLSKATSTALDKCKICRDTTWVGNAQRKGVCHFLVKEGRLEGWTRDDDEENI